MYSIITLCIIIIESGSWADVVECLHQAQLNYLASIIEEMYEHGRCEFNIIIQIMKYTHLRCIN